LPLGVSRPDNAMKSFWLMLAALCVLVCQANGQGTNPAALEKYADEGEKALSEGRYQDAEQAYKKLAELSPNTAEVHARLGVIYFQEKKFDQATPELRRALKLKPGLPNLDTLLAMSLSENGSYEEALPDLEKGFAHSTDPLVKRMAGLQLERAYTGLRKDQKAMEVALELNRLYPSDPEVLYHTGRLFGNFAYLNMQKLAQVAPDSVWRHQAAAEAYEAQGSFDLAVREYREVLARDPQRAGIHFRLGRTLMALSRQSNSAENTAEALKEFQQELQLDPSNANAAYELAETYRKSGEFPQAEQVFEQALRYYPDFEEAHLGLAAAMMSQQKPEMALPHLQKAIALNPNNDVSWYRLSQVERSLGNTAEQQKAMAEFQRVKGQKAAQHSATGELFSGSEITKQEIDQ
jgi:tetratricopeptide (TPR) repeat protein